MEGRNTGAPPDLIQAPSDLFRARPDLIQAPPDLIQARPALILSLSKDEAPARSSRREPP